MTDHRRQVYSPVHRVSRRSCRAEASQLGQLSKTPGRVELVQVRSITHLPQIQNPGPCWTVSGPVNDIVQDFALVTHLHTPLSPIDSFVETKRVGVFVRPQPAWVASRSTGGDIQGSGNTSCITRVLISQLRAALSLLGMIR
jgi:hypothetical protein